MEHPTIGVEALGPLAPGPAAAGVTCLAGNDNLDLIRFDGRLWFVWRTAPTHFASADARLEITSAPGVEGPWRHEHTVAMGSDVREPRWVVHDGALSLWFMRLGVDPKRFQPRGVHRIDREVDGDLACWRGPSQALPADIVPWRLRRLRGRWALLSYRGAEKMYSPRPADPTTEVRFSDDLVHWSEPVDVLDGGTECELVELDDGTLVGLTRNEGPSRRGGDLLVGDDVGSLANTPIPRKLDSPNLFVWHGQPFVIARRQVRFGGRYDVVPRRTPGVVAIRVDQAVWSLTRKRSSLYWVDVRNRSVEVVLDLPSRGDTSFAAVVPEPDGSLLVADYSSPESVGDVMWLRGQLGPTEISLFRLRRR